MIPMMEDKWEKCTWWQIVRVVLQKIFKNVIDLQTFLNIVSVSATVLLWDYSSSLPSWFLDVTSGPKPSNNQTWLTGERWMTAIIVEVAGVIGGCRWPRIKTHGHKWQLRCHQKLGSFPEISSHFSISTPCVLYQEPIILPKFPFSVMHF